MAFILTISCTRVTYFDCSCPPYCPASLSPAPLPLSNRPPLLSCHLFPSRFYIQEKPHNTCFSEPGLFCFTWWSAVQSILLKATLFPSLRLFNTQCIHMTFLTCSSTDGIRLLSGCGCPEWCCDRHGGLDHVVVLFVVLLRILRTFFHSHCVNVHFHQQTPHFSLCLEQYFLNFVMP